MAIFKISTATQNALANATAALHNSGTIEFRTGSLPANANSSITGTLVGTTTFGSTAFGSASAGVITANSITADSSADNSGTITYAVIRKSDATVIAICDVTATGGGGAMTISVDGVATTVVTAGQVITVTGLTITMPAN
jgi:hypothetical protein